MGEIHIFETYDNFILFEMEDDNLSNKIVTEYNKTCIEKGINNFHHLCNTQANFREHSDYMLILKLFKNDSVKISKYYKNKLISILNNSKVLNNFTEKELIDHISRSMINEISNDLKPLQITLLSA